MAQSFRTTSKVLADGTRKIFYYHKATGTRLPDDPASREFLDMVSRLDREALKQQAEADERNINWLIRQYKNSNWWKKDCSAARAAFSSVGMTSSARIIHAPRT